MSILEYPVSKANALTAKTFHWSVSTPPPPHTHAVVLGRLGSTKKLVHRY